MTRAAGKIAEKFPQPKPDPVAALIEAGTITEKQIVEYLCKQALADARERAA